MIKVGTDCTGIGAPEQALKNLDVLHSVEFACERDKYARKSYLENHSCKFIYPDIQTREVRQTPKVNLYVAGFPCQAFSVAGHRLGFEDIRGTIFFNCAEYIREHQPEVFIMENVAGLLSHDKPSGSKSLYGRTFSTMLNLLAASVNGQQSFQYYMDNLGYNVHFRVLNTADYGLPQNRERVYIVGIRPDLPNDFIFPKKVPLTNRVKDILEPEVSSHYFVSQAAINRAFRRNKNFLPKINPDITGTISTGNNSGKCIDTGTTLILRNGVVQLNEGEHYQQDRIFDAEGISPTIQATLSGGGPKFLVPSANKKGYEAAEEGDTINMNFPTSSTRRGRVGKQISPTLQAANTDVSVFIGGKIRRLTPRECFRLQGFPDSFKFVVSETQLYKQIGNAMSVKVIEAVIRNTLHLF